MIHGREGHGLGSRQEVRLPPLPVQRLDHGLRVAMAAIMPQAGQRHRVTFPGRDGPPDRYPGPPVTSLTTCSIIIGETEGGSGCGSGDVAGLFQTGSGQRLSPLVSPQVPGTNLTNGRIAPMPLRPVHAMPL